MKVAVDCAAPTTGATGRRQHRHGALLQTGGQGTATCNQHTQLVSSLQHGICYQDTQIFSSLQPGTCNQDTHLSSLQPGTCNQDTHLSSLQPGTCNQDTHLSSLQHGTCNQDTHLSSIQHGRDSHLYSTVYLASHLYSSLS